MVDIRKWRALTPPLVAYGVNCIAVYLASHLVASTLHVLKTGHGTDAVSLHQWINHAWFESWLSPANASLAFASMVVVLWFTSRPGEGC